ncbi:cobyric acid synthase [Striga asiatica]|uniref:Cobyric acid synthase n=1 Tax=Striga asiatica TaxID=4170 RepID=A0A5A7QNP3_STRAF|nr:cobyric acid synthase [Striga asiatica]
MSRRTNGLDKGHQENSLALSILHEASASGCNFMRACNSSPHKTELMQIPEKDSGHQKRLQSEDLQEGKKRTCSTKKPELMGERWWFQLQVLRHLWSVPLIFVCSMDQLIPGL